MTPILLIEEMGVYYEIQIRLYFIRPFSSRYSASILLVFPVIFRQFVKCSFVSKGYGFKALQQVTPYFSVNRSVNSFAI